MKVLFDHPHPFQLAHGGFQTQIEQTKAALEAHGVEVEYLRWWDAGQRGDLIHYFSAAATGYLDAARTAHQPVVMTTLFTETCNRSDAALRRQGLMTRLLLGLPGGEGIKRQLVWRAFNTCACNIVGLAAEQEVLETVYRVPREKIALVPLGLSETFLKAGPGDRHESHLICTGTITDRKRSIDLARLAHAAEVPILFVGKPYHPNDPYWREFEKLIDGKRVKHHPHVSTEAEMIRLLQSARGFVLLSRYENWCLSAHEAVACGLPLLVPDQKWSRERFANAATYFTGDFPRDVEVLRQFHAAAATAKPPQVKLWSWREAVVPLIATYERLLRTSR